MSKPLAIHNSAGFFTERWVDYCQKNGIPFRLVDCHQTDIVQVLKECSALLYNHHQGNPKDLLMAKPLLFALEQTGIPVFPDFNTNWHFDDKVGQKYLFEALNLESMIPTWVFYDKTEALEWVKQTSFPKVFKLRGGAGSQNVRLVKSARAARVLIRKAFGRGFPPYDAVGSLKERYRKYRLGKVSFFEVVKGLIRIAWPPRYARLIGRVKGYVYFQEFIPNNEFDIRVIVIDHKAFALKRLVRAGDFRASGSGSFKVERAEFREDTIQLAFQLSLKLKSQCVAFDFVYDQEDYPRVIEINYGFWPGGYDQCLGYWDENMNWYPGPFDPYGWMIELVINKTNT